MVSLLGGNFTSSDGGVGGGGGGGGVGFVAAFCSAFVVVVCTASVTDCCVASVVSFCSASIRFRTSDKSLHLYNISETWLYSNMYNIVI